jgi:hypothetical protein
MGYHDTLTGTDLHISRERFVPRNVAVDDFTIGAPFIADGALYPNQLDLSAIVPAGAKAVKLMIGVDVASELILFANQTTMIRNMIDTGTPMVGKNITVDINLDQVADDRLIDVTCAVGSTLCQVAVLGWYL